MVFDFVVKVYIFMFLLLLFYIFYCSKNFYFQGKNLLWKPFLKIKTHTCVHAHTHTHTHTHTPLEKPPPPPLEVCLFLNLLYFHENDTQRAGLHLPI